MTAVRTVEECEIFLVHYLTNKIFIYLFVYLFIYYLLSIMYYLSFSIKMYVVTGPSGLIDRVPNSR